MSKQSQRRVDAKIRAEMIAAVHQASAGLKPNQFDTGSGRIRVAASCCWLKARRMRLRPHQATVHGSRQHRSPV